MTFDAPHRITLDQVDKALDEWLVWARARTADNTQDKRLKIALGRYEFIVERAYIEHEVFPSWQVIYQGDDAKKAVDAYNRLS